jgi:hypothetical protein
MCVRAGNTIARLQTKLGEHRTRWLDEQSARLKAEDRLHQIHNVLIEYHDDPGSMSAKLDIVIAAMEKAVELSAVEIPFPTFVGYSPVSGEDGLTIDPAFPPEDELRYPIRG